MKIIVLLCLTIVAVVAWGDFGGPSGQMQTLPVELPAPSLRKVPIWPEEDQMQCLTKMVYGEAANQPYEGKVAVAAVAVNRTLSGRWGATLCDTIRQPNQFAGYWRNAEVSNALDLKAWKESEAASLFATTWYDHLPEPYRSAYFFNAQTVPEFTWAPVLDRIGDHVFYGDAR